MRFWNSPYGAAIVVGLLAVLLVLGVTAVQVHLGTTPPRQRDPAIDFDAMRVAVENVRLEATDGLPLDGWFVAGQPGMPAVILCHDAGAAKASLLNLALAIRAQGFSVLLFDFRGHGSSGDARSTLGLDEKLDVLGAIDFIAAREELDPRRIGLYGVGMGAYAAVLAAPDRPALKVLVLDGLYPDVEYRLVRQVYAGWGFAVDRLGFLPRGVFAVMRGGGAGHQRAADVIGSLLGRDFLFLVPAGNTGLAREIQHMYESIPDQADADGNLVVLPATQSDGLYEEQLARYHERVSEFFQLRLGSPSDV